MAQKSTVKGLNDYQNIPQTQKHKVWMTHKNIPQTGKKTKVTYSYIKSVSVVSNSLGLILVSIAIQCRISF
jgi:hypothetical protein